MKPFIFFLFLLGGPSILSGQFQEDFTQGDLEDRPEWTGDRALFRVENGRLRLSDPNAEANNTAYLSVYAPTSTTAGTNWSFWVRQEFPPSASNYTRVYLSASAPNLSGPQRGYYLQIGGEAGDADAVELYRQDGNTRTLLLRASDGAVAFDPAQAALRVNRDESGRWTLWADYTGQGDFQLEGEVVDATYDRGDFFGFLCQYTRTRAAAFFFDDILIDPLFVDREPPRLLSVSSETPETLRLRFDKALDPASVASTDRYLISPDIGQPLSANPVEDDPSALRLRLPGPMLNRRTYTVSVEGLRDRAGNVAPLQSLIFTYFEARAPRSDELLLTEIMADPNPPVADLPEAEYIELYNRGEALLLLEGVQLVIGRGRRTLPALSIPPQSYLVICDISQEDIFAEYGPAAGIPSFPAVPNAGGEIALIGLSGDTLAGLFYQSDWYGDPGKAQGGWSLELIDLESPNDCALNWRAAAAPRGGTPGQPNSAAGLFLPMPPPILLRAAAETPEEVILFFNAPLDPAVAAQTGRYGFEPPLTVAQAIPQAPGNREILLLLDAPLRPGTTYTLSVDDSMRDCLGRPFGERRATRLGLAETPAPLDIVINELLFQPQTGGRSFVELFNRSDKIINLDGMTLRNAQRVAGVTTEQLRQPFLLFPGEYAVITEDTASLQQRYYVENSLALIPNRLPTFDAGQGNLSISFAGTIIDAFDYRDDMHFGLLASRRGVSLERIDPDGPTQSAGNWHSAAASVGFATPTYRNSQFLAAPEASRPGIFSLPNRTFSPDGDGFEDVLIIQYRVDQPGWTANLRIFDAQGRQVRRLVNNELLAAEGQFKWDGVTDNGARARMGIYIIWIELFRPDGAVERFKEVCVLAGRLE
jgi:hypothetical protein